MESKKNTRRPTFCFIGKTGAGKTALMNALAQKVLGRQAKPGQLNSETLATTIYRGVSWMGGPELVDFVDTQGLMDTEGRDQMIVDTLKNDFENKAPNIDMFILCFEAGKFDRSMQIVVETYLKLLKDEKKFWQNMTAVITKVSYSVYEHKQINDWCGEMYKWILGLHQEFIKHYG